MASILLFHSALGLRPAVKSFADRLGELGHTVHTPDLFDGEVFDDLTAGVTKRDQIGIPTLLHRAFAAADGLPDDLLYAGFSMGTAPAQALATTRPGAQGLLLMHGALAPSTLDLSTWPASLPVQVHTSPADPWMDETAVAELGALVPSTLWEHHQYPGTRHLFSDEHHDDHNAQAAASKFARVRDFLARLERG